MRKLIIMNDLKISVIVPVYKVEKYICQCLDSIISQTYKNLEILLIDDGSPDNCPAICDKYANKDNRIKVIHKKNGGLASARNVGLDVASGDLISFVDSDDWIEDCMFQEMLRVMLETKSTIVCCEGVHTDGEMFWDKCFDCKPTGTVVSGHEATKEILLDKVGSQAVKGLYERKCWNEVRFPIGMLYEDIPTTFKAFQNAERVGYLNREFYKYRINPQSISGSPNPLKSYHQFLGFKSHYDCAKIKYPEVAVECCSKTAHFAISALLHSYTDANEQLSQYADEIKKFLKDHKEEIDFRFMPKSRSCALRVFFISEKLFAMMTYLFYKTGLQKKMGFDIK